MKKEIEIFIIGGTRALAVYSSLRKRYTQVYYFRNERECRKSMYLNPDVLIIDESLKNSDPMLFLSSINELSDAHIIYLSKNNHFNQIIKVLKSGASDYIIKDSYLHYSINRFVARLINSTNGLSNEISRYDCRDQSELRHVYPVKFRLFQWFTRP